MRSLLSVVLLIGYSVYAQEDFSIRYGKPVKYDSAAIATNNGQCSKVGADIMRNGGNAIDATIAAELCLGVMEPQSTGLGGGFFATIYIKAQKKCTVIDARESAPAAGGVDFFTDGQQRSSVRGWSAIAVPGVVKGLWKAHQMFGKKPWREVVMPAVELARDGFTVSIALGRALITEDESDYRNDTASLIQAEPLLSELVDPSTGKVWLAGQTITRPKYANTLQRLADAADADQLFYEGAMADEIGGEFESFAPESVITKQDLKDYEVKVYDAIQFNLPNGQIICAPPPPSSGAVTASLIDLVAGYNQDPSSLETKEGAALFNHRLVEAMKFVFANRSILGDSAFGPSNITHTESFDSDTWGNWVRSMIDDTRTFPSAYYGGNFQIKTDHGTAVTTVIDQEGNAMSITCTINLYFGALKASPSAGIIWNNEMDDFSQPSNEPNAFGFYPSPSNFMYPGKRPMSSMSPILIYDPTTGDVTMAIGATGASKIISGIAQTVLKTLFFNTDLTTSIDMPRIHNQLYPEETLYDVFFHEEIVNMLKQKGHKMIKRRLVNWINGVFREPSGRIEAHSDFRKGADAFPDGF